MQALLFDPEVSYISVACAAQRLGVSRQRVHQLMRGGGLTGIRSGHVYLVRARDVEKRLQDLKRKGFVQYNAR